MKRMYSKVDIQIQIIGFPEDSKHKIAICGSSSHFPVEEQIGLQRPIHCGQEELPWLQLQKS